jgi:hypothetical protein
MSRFLRCLQLINVLSLTLWSGILVMAGAAAAFTFPTLKGLRLNVAGFTVPEADQWSLVGGMVAAKFFLVADIAGYVLGGLATVSLAILVFRRTSLPPVLHMSRTHLAVRIITTALAMCILCYQLFILAPRMNENLKGYWSSAAASPTPETQSAAAKFKASFDVDHPEASKVLVALAIATLAASLAAAWPASRTSIGSDF